MKINTKRLKNNLSPPSTPKNTKFMCRNCNKRYNSLLGAIYCTCNKKIKWKERRT